MKVHVDLYILSSELEYFFKSSLIQDIIQNKGDISMLDKGYSYTKHIKNRMGVEHEVLVTIQQLEMGVYSVYIDQGNKRHVMTYTYEQNGAISQVDYEENFVSDSLIEKVNFLIMNTAFYLSNKKRMTQHLKAIEAAILSSED